MTDWDDLGDDVVGEGDDAHGDDRDSSDDCSDGYDDRYEDYYNTMTATTTTPTTTPTTATVVERVLRLPWQVDGRQATVCTKRCGFSIATVPQLSTASGFSRPTCLGWTQDFFI